MMKRRKTLNKYTVGDHGQITNNHPTLSPRTRKMLEIFTMAEMIKELSSDKYLSDDDVEIVGEEDVTGDTIDVEPVSDDKEVDTV